VDKPSLLNNLKGLRVPQATGQGLHPAGTLTGQKNAGGQVGQFRTFAPVDMHGLIHRRPVSVSTSCFQSGASLTGVGDFLQVCEAKQTEAPLAGVGNIETRFQVYQQKVCIQNSSNS